MKQNRSGLLKVAFSWLVIYSIAFSPLRVHAEQAANDNYNPRHLPVVITPKNTGLTIIKQDEVKAEDAKALETAEPTHVLDTESNNEIPLNAAFKENSTAEERKNTSPKNLLRRYAEAAARVPVAGAKTAAASPRLAVDSAIHFPAEASSFYAAMGVLAVAELNAPGSANAKNPAVLDQFIEHSFKDPVGAISFYGFMLVSRQTETFFKELGLNGGGVIEESKFAQAKAMFKGVLASQVAMSAGFLAQTVFTELYHDKEARMCLARWGVKQAQKVTNGVSVKLQPDSPEILEACENAYDRWSVRQKIKDYLPQISSMIAVGVMQAAAIPLASWIIKSEAGEAITAAIMRTRGIGVILEGLSLSVRVGGKYIWPEGGLVAKVASMVIFLKASEALQPLFDKYIGREFKADDLADITNRFEEKLSAAANNSWQEVQFANLSDKRKNDPSELLKKVGGQYQAFRAYQLQKGHGDYENWKQALIKFQSSYISSYAMYDKLIGDVQEFRRRGNNNRYSGENPPALFLSRESPTYRVGTLIPKNLAKIKLGSDPLSDLLTRVRDYYLANQKNLTQQQDLILRNINFGLEMAYRDLSASELDVVIKKANLGSLTNEQRESLSVEVRAKRLDNALKLFKQVGHQLTSNNSFKIQTTLKGALNDIKKDYKTMNFDEFMWYTYSNLIDWVDVAVTVAGYDYYHRELSGNSQLISQEAMKNVPNHYEKAFTPNMSDYLLASMVCGPRSQGGAQAKQNQTSMLSKALNWFNFNNQNKQTFQNLSLVEYTPGFGFEFLPPRLVVDTIADADLCGHTPKRAKSQNILTAFGEFVTGQSVEKQNLSVVPYFNVNTGEYIVNKETHYGFLPLVKFYMNPKFLAKPTGTSTAFFDYWQTEVVPQVNKAALGFQKMYRDLVMKDFVPSFVSGEYRVHKNRKLHYGVGWSLREEGTYYSDLLKRMVPSSEMDQQIKIYKRNLELSVAMFSQPEKVKQATQIILNTMKDDSQKPASDDNNSDNLSELNNIDNQTGFTQQQIAAVRTAADPAAQAAMVLLIKNLKTNIANIQSVITKTNIRGTAKTVANQLAKNMEQVSGEAESYNGVIRAANLQGLPEVSDLQ